MSNNIKEDVDGDVDSDVDGDVDVDGDMLVAVCWWRYGRLVATASFRPIKSVEFKRRWRQLDKISNFCIDQLI